jgi:hypothetical protein
MMMIRIPHQYAVGLLQSPTKRYPSRQNEGNSSKQNNPGDFEMADALKESKVRFQIDLTPKQAERFDGLMKHCELGSRKELFNVAMSLFYWASQEASKGRKIASYDEENDHVETILVPALESVSLHAADHHSSTARDVNSKADRKTFGVVQGRKAPVMSCS